MVSKYIDLSRTIKPGIGELPGHPVTVIEEFQSHARDGRSNAKLSMSIHYGTHVDCPFHFFVEGKKVDELPLTNFTGEGFYLELSEAGRPGYRISETDLLGKLKEYNIDAEELENSFLILRTGWGKLHYEKGDYYQQNPYLSEEAVKFLIEHNLKGIGLDFPPDNVADQLSPVHRLFLKAGVIIIENLTNLSALPHKGFTLQALPVKIEKQSGGMARVIAIRDDA